MIKIITQIVIVAAFLLIIPMFKSALAASLQLDPANINTTSGQVFEVKININAGTDNVVSADTWISYDSTILEPQSVKNGDFFPTVSNSLQYVGKAYVAGMVEDATSSKTGSGTIATLVFKSKKNGSANLTFNCGTGSTSDSHISKNDVNATDIIQCSSNGRSTVTVATGTSGGSSPTTAPTVVPTTVSGGSGGNSGAVAPTSASLPRSGKVENMLVFSMSGAALIFLGVVFRLLL